VVEEHEKIYRSSTWSITRFYFSICFKTQSETTQTLSINVAKNRSSQL